MNNFEDNDLSFPTEESKKSKTYLEAKVERLIAESLSPRRGIEIKKAYNLRHGIRDNEQFDHITKKYGVEFPAHLSHTPLIDRHVKVLEGEMEELPLNYRISCMDKNSLTRIAEEKQKGKSNAIASLLSKQIEHSYDNAIQGKKPTIDFLSDDEIFRVNNHYNTRWKSNLEISAQHVLNYETQRLKFKAFSDKTFSDLTTCGEEYYVSKIIGNGKVHWFERLDPNGCFFRKTSDNEMINKCVSFVYIRMESRAEILAKWGDQMTADQIEKLGSYTGRSDNYVIVNGSPIITDEFINDRSAIGVGNKYFKVWYTEWIATNEVDGKYRPDLYQGIRIERDIYVDLGKYKYVTRNPDNPNDITLNFNGILYDEYEAKGRSMFLDTEDIQNKYDIYDFHLDNAVALSGNKVQTVILENIPTIFGTSQTERLIKHQEYTKHGFNYVSLGQEGSKEFNNYGQAVDLSLGNGVEQIRQNLQNLELRASLITGVSPAQMGEVSPYAGQGQTKLVVNRSSLVVRKLFSTHFKFCQAALTSILNNCRHLYKEGFKGVYVLGDLVTDFTLDENLSLSFLGVTVSSDIFEWKAVEDFKQMSIQLAGQDKLDVADSVDIYTSKSMTEIKDKLVTNLEKKKKDKTQEMQQQLEQAGKQIQELEGKVKQFDEASLQIETNKLLFDKEKLSKEIEIKEKELEELKRANIDSHDIKVKQLELEQLQITFSPASKEVKNIS